ncbi:hypothetical protein V8C86DRAFT_619745 [Haematococcus lacustris]
MTNASFSPSCRGHMNTWAARSSSTSPDPDLHQPQAPRTPAPATPAAAPAAASGPPPAPALAAPGPAMLQPETSVADQAVGKVPARRHSPTPPPCQPAQLPAGPSASALVDALSSEVVRKLRLAGEADSKEDREVVCEEVFCDVTGLLDGSAQAQLGLQGAPQPFYQILARHYASARGADSAVVVLYLLQNLYGQGYAAPLMALLMHRWLLLKRAKPGGGLPEEQRLRLVNVTALGAAQLFLGDVHGGAYAFEPLWRCLCYEVILGQAAPSLPPTSSAVMPTPASTSAAAELSPSHPADIGPATTMGQALAGPSSLSAAPLRLVTRLRLQSELYSLTSLGAPYYAPPAVRRAALRTLDSLFPQGKAVRHIVRGAFRLLHPTDWLGEFWVAPVRWLTWAYGKVLLSLFQLIYSLVVFQIWGRPADAALELTMLPLPTPRRQTSDAPCGQQPDGGVPLAQAATAADVVEQQMD